MKKIILLYLLASVTLMLKAQPSTSLIKKLESAIVRIESGKKIGTGFLWKKNNWVISTLHLIDDDSDIEVTLANEVMSAKVIKVLKEYDLVLLQLESNTTGLTVITNTNYTPTLNSSLYTMGYNGKGNLNTIIDRTLRLGFNSNGKLEGLLSKTIKDALTICKRPNPSIEILYLDGSLLPGFSGSPIIDNNGKLVGIADGGLEEGSSSISWGIKAGKLNTLLGSKESFPKSITCGIGTKSTFSSENLLEETNVQFIEYKQFKFIKTKTRTIQEMMQTIDDPEGLKQLISSYSMYNNTNYSQFKYDIYEDLYSGMTFCVPQGTKLKVINNLIIGDFKNTDFKLIIYPDYIKHLDPNPLLRYTTSAQTFQQTIIALDGGHLTYNKDFNMSYKNGPIIRYDGIKVNREAYRGFTPIKNSFGQVINSIPKSYSFQTHIGRENYYMGAAALNMNSTLEDINNLNYCLNTGNCGPPTCENICNEYELFSQLVLGVHMGGFSNNYNRLK